MLARTARAFIREKLEENTRRLRKYGSSVYLLEPNIKEGEGGLRDLHTALWIATVKFKARSLRDLIIKGVLTEREGKVSKRPSTISGTSAMSSIISPPARTIRFISISRRKSPSFSAIRTTSEHLAVEQFMQDYYSHATRVEHLSSSLIDQGHPAGRAAFRILGYLTRRSVEDGFYILRGELRLSQARSFRSRIRP